MKKFLFIFLLLLTLSRHSFAYYEFDKKLERAYVAILAFQFDEANKLLSQEKTEKPGNALRLLYLNYIDFIKAFVTDERSQFELLKANSSKRLNELQQDKSNSVSPFHLYVQSEIYIQQALVRIKFEENIMSASEIRKAYKLIEKNQNLFPDFILNKKVLGFLHAIVGAVPLRYKWLVKIAGMDGNLIHGINELHNTFENVGPTIFQCYQTEILFYMGNIYSVFSMTSDSNKVVSMMSSLTTKSPLIAYVYSNILMKQGKNDESLSVLNKALESNSNYPFTFLYYKRGLARLRKLDYSALNDFDYFLNHYKGLNNIKAACQKKAWIALLKGDTAKYIQENQICKSRGNSILDDDKDAEYEAITGEIANPILLRSRLLFDGGYYSNALSQLAGGTLVEFPSHRDQLEVTYRIARIMQMTGQTEKAINYFEMTLKNGISSKYYFAANSSLMLGLIYEEKKQIDKARTYFQKCLSMEYEQYKNSIDQKAQAGLDRIKGDK